LRRSQVAWSRRSTDGDASRQLSVPARTHPSPIGYCAR
jgi:hypothetical protein